MHHKFIIVPFIHNFLRVLKAFRLNVSFNGGQTCTFSEPVHLKSVHGKACLTTPDN